MTEFVGREEEISRISTTLAAGTNVVLTGKFGIGRTSLVRRVAAETNGRWHFIFGDFSCPPAVVCRQVASQILRPLRTWRRLEEPPYRQNRRQLLEAARKATPPFVLVLDNVRRMTVARWDLVRFLSREARLRIVIIVESFLPESDVARLRTNLYPSIRVQLGRLPARESHEFFERVSRRNGLGWSGDRIRALAARGGGFPLAMAEAAAEAATRGRR